MAIILFFWIFFAVASGIVGASKGRTGFGWFILGCVFGIFALIIVALLPSIKKDYYAPSPATHRRCPDCCEFVLIDAVKCKHCGSSLAPPSTATPLAKFNVSDFTESLSDKFK